MASQVINSYTWYRHKPSCPVLRDIALCFLSHSVLGNAAPYNLERCKNSKPMTANDKRLSCIDPISSRHTMLAPSWQSTWYVRLMSEYAISSFIFKTFRGVNPKFTHLIELISSFFLLSFNYYLSIMLLYILHQISVKALGLTIRFMIDLNFNQNELLYNGSI